MDLFKNVKELKDYRKELTTLYNLITANESKVKIGKFRIIQTPTNEAAARLSMKLCTVIGKELEEITEAYSQIEQALENVQTNLFKNEEEKEAQIVFNTKTK